MASLTVRSFDHSACGRRTSQVKQIRYQVAAVLTAKGCIAAASYRIRLEITTTRRIFSMLYNGPGDVPQTAPSPTGGGEDSPLKLRPYGAIEIRLLLLLLFLPSVL